MALKIRLQRQGRIHLPSYRIVVAESTSRRDGKFVEKIGVYEPQAKGLSPKLTLKLDRADYWTSVGAKATDTVSHLIRVARSSASSN